MHTYIHAAYMHTHIWVYTFVHIYTHAHVYVKTGLTTTGISPTGTSYEMLLHIKTQRQLSPRAPPGCSHRPSRSRRRWLSWSRAACSRMARHNRLRHWPPVGEVELERLQAASIPSSNPPTPPPVHSPSPVPSLLISLLPALAFPRVRSPSHSHNKRLS